jgi:hypothetical protein
VDPHRGRIAARSAETKGCKGESGEDKAAMSKPADVGKKRAATGGFACAVLAVLVALLMYWLWLPSIILGALGLGLGIVGRRQAFVGGSARDLAVAAIALGVVAILITPAVNLIAKGEADYGRKCALNPEQHDC